MDQFKYSEGPKIIDSIHSALHLDWLRSDNKAPELLWRLEILERHQLDYISQNTLILSIHSTQQYE